MRIRKITKARVLGWGQLIITVLNEALTANNGVIPNTKAAWIKIAISLVTAWSLHTGAETSAGHPNGGM